MVYLVSIRMHFAAHSLMTRCVLTSDKFTKSFKHPYSVYDPSAPSDPYDQIHFRMSMHVPLFYVCESVFSLRVSSGLSGQVLFTLVLFEAFTSVSGMSRERFIRSAMPPTSIAVSSIAPAMTSSKL